MSKKPRTCCICNRKLPLGNYGNNPEPVKPYSTGVCCDDCNRKKVIPARLARATRTDKGIGVVLNHTI